LYGVDLYGRKSLPELLCKLSDIDSIQWIRLLYAYPEEITDELIEIMSTNEKICHYIDMPIQSGSDDVLKRMGRRTRADEITNVVSKLRSSMSDICIRTTLISGFPGETQADHEETYRFVNETEFDRLGIFTYSAEEGTPAYDFNDRVDEETAKARRDELYELQQAIAFEKAGEMTGKVLRVIVDGYLPEDGVYVARSYKDAPDIDGLVFVKSDTELITGDMIDVLITGAKDYDLEGEAVHESSQ
ncbi:MAG: radical SAM protein, partial [Lachnospiraceae bacterium]|nr:radical SAM protein [Lachnospiraceae bacterium]